ncbi:MAG TPA: ferrous iron transport protein B [Candidatus Omnitrophota bacterium]|nr:ferrous iron transport protein B [Candidatus Omnitrophota bacterium]HRY85474.1 ferrous iron transport protein B [Candidatus Omnitrophota bacterium]
MTASGMKEIVLAGNPNTGKTTVFNALTGLRHTTANYPGVTVEKRAGMMKLKNGETVSVIDLPGAYSLLPRSPDEKVVHNVLLGAQKGTPPPDLVVVVLAANNLERNLYFGTQVASLGLRTVFAVNMWDAAQEQGLGIDLNRLQNMTGVPCVPTVGTDPKGIEKLQAAIEEELAKPSVRENTFDPKISPEVRYKTIENIVTAIVKHPGEKKITLSERIDRVLTHRVWGLLAFLGVMTFVFQSIFSWAQVPMDWVSRGIEYLASWTRAILPDGALESLVVDGVIAGVGNVVVFLPQIMLLFFFIAFFEDTGYMARAVFVLDRIMKMVGLNGKAFLPLLSSFACTVPGVLATRTIEDRNDRLATILVAPLMSCSARLPIYTLLAAAFVPAKTFFHVFSLQGATLLAMYLLSIGTGLGMAAIFRKTFLKGNQVPFVFELPPYRMPHFGTILAAMWDRSKEFIVRAGSIIFLLSIVLWFCVSYPKNPAAETSFSLLKKQAETSLAGDALKSRLSEIDQTQKDFQIRTSFAGSFGRAIEPAIRPLGFNWEIGIGIVASFAARELLISTLAIVHHAQSEGEGMTASLIEALQSAKSPETGKPLYTPLVAIALMVFYVFACQCFSTYAVLKRETGSWGWTFFTVAYMTGLAWGSAFIVYQGGQLLGFK